MEDASARRVPGFTPPKLAARPRDAWFLAVAALVVGLDQLTKWFASGRLGLGERWPDGWPVHFVHVTNSGAAFGILQDSGPLLAVTSVFGMAAILVYLFNPGFAHPLLRLGLAMMLGGAIGNLIDRVANGEVVDFVKFPHWPAFNLADSAITIGVILLVWTITFETGEATSANSS
ncbi:MAG: signal peptidase II [Chloroflexi bacterium]|nr:signal peptidase II [Chloroflexota bacterium]